MPLVVRSDQHASVTPIGVIRQRPGAPPSERFHDPRLSDRDDPYGDRAVVRAGYSPPCVCRERIGGPFVAKQ